MKVNVNLFKSSGKWAYGGVVDVDEDNPMFLRSHFQDLIDKQDFVADGAFENYLVVVTHCDDYEADTSSYFCQCAYEIGHFLNMRKTKSS